MAEKFASLILGVNPYSYLLHRLTGIPVIGQMAHFPQFHYQTPMNHDLSLLDHVDLPLELEMLQTGLRYRSMIWSSWPDPIIKEQFLKKIALTEVQDVGTSLYLSLKLESKDWFKVARFSRIFKRNGIFQIQLESGDIIEVERLLSTLPLMLLAKMMREILSLKKYYIYRYNAKLSPDELDPNYACIYEFDEKPYRYVRLRDSNGRSHWVEEYIYEQELPKEEVSKVKHFYTLPVPVSGPMLEFNGVELYGTYAQWDYRLTIADVIDRYFKSNSNI